MKGANIVLYMVKVKVCLKPLFKGLNFIQEGMNSHQLIISESSQLLILSH